MATIISVTNAYQPDNRPIKERRLYVNADKIFGFGPFNPHRTKYDEEHYTNAKSYICFSTKLVGDIYVEESPEELDNMIYDAEHPQQCHL